MSPLEIARLQPLMQRTQGARETSIGLIDGPVFLGHSDFGGAVVREIEGRLNGECRQASSMACTHGTFVAGILSARRGSVAPAICPGCTLVLRPIFSEAAMVPGQIPVATPEELASAIADCTNAGSRVINLSAALTPSFRSGEMALADALNYAAHRGVIVVAAAGNQGMIGSTAITRHPWVIPVTACDAQGAPTAGSNLGNSIGGRGLGAPGDNITSLGTEGSPRTLSGTSAAAPFVTGAIALLWSAFPDATSAEIRGAVTQSGGPRRRAITPPLLNASAAYSALSRVRRGKAA